MACLLWWCSILAFLSISVASCNDAQVAVPSKLQTVKDETSDQAALAELEDGQYVILEKPPTRALARLRGGFLWGIVGLFTWFKTPQRYTAIVVAAALAEYLLLLWYRDRSRRQGREDLKTYKKARNLLKLKEKEAWEKWKREQQEKTL